VGIHLPVISFGVITNTQKDSRTAQRIGLHRTRYTKYL